jgi:hypothetical protein
MALSQPARFGEDWSDERVKGYLNRQAPDGDNADFHVLYTAYKHMRAFDFERFVGFFLAAGRDLNARNSDGMTLLELVRQHPAAADIVAILEQASA